MEELKPCPFCKGDGSISIENTNKIVYGSCWTCGARGPVVQFKVKPTERDIIRAISLWNERVQ